MMPEKINENDWIIRDALPDELNFIYATWLNNYRYDSSIGKSCKNTVFFLEYPCILDSILDRSKVLVAYFPDTPKVILSYLVYEPGVLHYLFTKEVYRNNGIAMSLFLKAFPNCGFKAVDFSHRTLMSEPILQKYNSYLNFNPFKLYKKLEGDKK
jgi:hypothetical protein